ncbi:formate dehydrogenase-specific chaperone [Cupriavidus basilensis OR16]|uniref:Formate dehydrogenase-specific chaperone n=1 Tax=Cupriavidus basilensis OR16 TaxID=1127483 RepID=H1SAI7_9BURK|nr:molecular chaperone TorD family protein [Cupriavidus basilensis]EHP40460.1 formate dehydrogenase-specific chaperone [Cupriavidus basilensis OR16]
MTDFQPIQLIPPASKATADAEDTARADLYGLLATLLYRAPDAALLHHIAANRAHGEDAMTPLGEAWNGLCDAASVTTAAQAADEYQQLFIGVGKPEVFLYGSYYQTGFLNERPVVALRDDLARYGLVRQDNVTETEDHIATLCEVMRFLVAGEDAGIANLAEQQQFFSRHLQSWVETMCDAAAAHPQARLYVHVAGLLKAFMAVEAIALDMH